MLGKLILLINAEDSVRGDTLSFNIIFILLSSRRTSANTSLSDGRGFLPKIHSLTSSTSWFNPAENSLCPLPCTYGIWHYQVCIAMTHHSRGLTLAIMFLYSCNIHSLLSHLVWTATDWSSTQKFVMNFPNRSKFLWPSPRRPLPCVETNRSYQLIAPWSLWAMQWPESFLISNFPSLDRLSLVLEHLRLNSPAFLAVNY